MGGECHQGGGLGRRLTNNDGRRGEWRAWRRKRILIYSYGWDIGTASKIEKKNQVLIFKQVFDFKKLI